MTNFDGIIKNEFIKFLEKYIAFKLSKNLSK